MILQKEDFETKLAEYSYYYITHLIPDIVFDSMDLDKFLLFCKSHNVSELYINYKVFSLDDILITPKLISSNELTKNFLRVLLSDINDESGCIGTYYDIFLNQLDSYIDLNYASQEKTTLLNLLSVDIPIEEDDEDDFDNEEEDITLSSVGKNLLQQINMINDNNYTDYYNTIKSYQIACVIDSRFYAIQIFSDNDTPIMQLMNVLLNYQNTVYQYINILANNKAKYQYELAIKLDNEKKERELLKEQLCKTLLEDSTFMQLTNDKLRKEYLLKLRDTENEYSELISQVYPKDLIYGLRNYSLFDDIKLYAQINGISLGKYKK